MYNHRMPATGYQIRLCTACGLRYPLLDGHSFGTRCPVCMGATRLVLHVSRDLIPDQPAGGSSPAGKEKKSALHDRSRNNHPAVLLDNIRSAWNVGSILRSSDGFGFSHAYLCGISPTPDGPAREAVLKTSLGAEVSVPWSYHKNAVKLVRGLKKEGWKIWALEEHERAGSLSELTAPPQSQSCVLMVGNEVSGVDPELLDLSDEIFHIPMRGEKRSFNVAMAFSIAAYQIHTSGVLERKD